MPLTDPAEEDSDRGIVTGSLRREKELLFKSKCGSKSSKIRAGVGLQMLLCLRPAVQGRKYKFPRDLGLITTRLTDFSDSDTYTYRLTNLPVLKSDFCGKILKLERKKHLTAVPSQQSHLAGG